MRSKNWPCKGIAWHGMAWKARAPHSPVPEAPLSYGKAKRNTVPPRKSIACPGYDPRFVETRRDGYVLTRIASEARCTARKRAAKARNRWAATSGAKDLHRNDLTGPAGAKPRDQLPRNCAAARSMA